MAAAVVPPLLQAARDGNIEEVNKLLESGVDVNQTGPGNTSALLMACGMGNKDVVLKLLDAGADINHKSTSGSTSLIMAASSHVFRKADKKLDVLNIITKLLSKGANINEKANDGRTAIHGAAFVGNNIALSLLILHRANVNVKDNKGMTPLHFAVLGGHKDVVAKLLKTPAVNIRSLNLEGKTAKQLALEKGNREIINMLSEAWVGWSQSDLGILEILNIPNLVANFSCCPVCLAYQERSGDCMYMSHKCPNVGGHYDERLYNLFKNDEGKVQWCAVCGRICKDHKHFPLMYSDIDRLPELLEPGALPAGVNIGDTRAEYPYTIFGDERGCIRYGGGGMREKIARFRALREKALELSLPEAEPRTYYDASIQMIEAAWMAPLSPEEMNKAAAILSRNVGRRRWNINISRFPTTTKPRAIPIISDEELWPFEDIITPNRKVADPGEVFTNEISYDEYTLGFQLRHIQQNKSMIEHPIIPLNSLFRHLNSASVVGEDNFGVCPFYNDEPKCKAILYPGELQYILNNAPSVGEGSISDEERKGYQDIIDVYTLRFKEQFSNSAGFREHIERDMMIVNEIKRRRQERERRAMLEAAGGGGGGGGGGNGRIRIAAGGAGAAEPIWRGGARRRSTRRRQKSMSKQTRHK